MTALPPPDDGPTLVKYLVVYFLGACAIVSLAHWIGVLP